MKNKKIILFVIALVFFIFSIALVLSCDYNHDDIRNINEVINNSDNKDEVLVFLNIKWFHKVYFSTYGRNNRKYYYIAFDGRHYYIVASRDRTFESKNEKGIMSNPLRIEGVTNKMSSKIRKKIINEYNKKYKLDNLEITEDNFNDLFGDIYIDLDTTFTSKQNGIMTLAFCCFLVDVGIAMYIIFSKIIKKREQKKIINS